MLKGNVKGRRVRYKNCGGDAIKGDKEALNENGKVFKE